MDALEPDEAIRFGEHLLGCAPCRQAVAELEPVSRMLTRAAGMPAPPSALRARTLTAVERAAEESRRRPDGDAR